MVNKAYALSARGVATTRPTYARPALLDSAMTRRWPAFGYDDLRSMGRREGEELRGRLGRTVLAVMPGRNAHTAEGAGPKSDVSGGGAREGTTAQARTATQIAPGRGSGMDDAGTARNGSTR